MLAVALLVGRLEAHEPFQSYVTARVLPTQLEITVRLSLIAAEALLHQPPKMLLTEESFPQLAPELKAVASTLVSVTTAQGAVPCRTASVYLTEEIDLEFLLVFPRPPGGEVSLNLAYLAKMTTGHRTTLAIGDEAGNNLGWEELGPEYPVFVAQIPAPAAVVGQSPPPTAAPPLFGKFLRLGVKHILTGYDHLLFLCGLLLVCRRWRTMATIITCFTLAHSVTLALAALGLVALPGKIVEPLIAASIVYVGVENLLRPGEPPGRWALTSAFGLIHGFGFAGTLIEAGLGKNGTPLLVPLFSFNLGVELGQLAVAAVFIPCLWLLRTWPPFARYGTRVLSVLISLAGTYWLLQRTLFSP